MIHSSVDRIYDDIYRLTLLRTILLLLQVLVLFNQYKLYLPLPPAPSLHDNKPSIQEVSFEKKNTVLINKVLIKVIYAQSSLQNKIFKGKCHRSISEMPDTLVI